MPTTSKKPHVQCQYCPMSFAKKEHLERHIRTHSGERPFACNVCGKTFARQDTLNRHARLHNRTEEELAAKARRRRVKSLSISSSSANLATNSTTSINSPTGTNHSTTSPLNTSYSTGDAIFISHHHPHLSISLPNTSSHMPHRRYSDITSGGGRRPNFFGWSPSLSNSSHLVRSVESGIIPLPQVEDPWSGGEVFSNSPISNQTSLTTVSSRKKSPGGNSIDIFYENCENDFRVETGSSTSGGNEFSPISNPQDLYQHHQQPHQTPFEYLQQHTPQTPSSPYSSPHLNHIFLPPPVPHQNPAANTHLPFLPHHSSAAPSAATDSLSPIQFASLSLGVNHWANLVQPVESMADEVSTNSGTGSSGGDSPGSGIGLSREECGGGKMEDSAIGIGMAVEDWNKILKQQQQSQQRSGSEEREVGKQRHLINHHQLQQGISPSSANGNQYPYLIQHHHHLGLQPQPPPPPHQQQHQQHFFPSLEILQSQGLQLDLFGDGSFGSVVTGLSGGGRGASPSSSCSSTGSLEERGVYKDRFPIAIGSGNSGMEVMPVIREGEGEEKFEVEMVEDVETEGGAGEVMEVKLDD